MRPAARAAAAMWCLVMVFPPAALRRRARDRAPGTARHRRPPTDGACLMTRVRSITRAGARRDDPPPWPRRQIPCRPAATPVPEPSMRLVPLALAAALIAGPVAAQPAASAPPAAQSGAAFLAANAKAPGVVTLPSGL